MAHLKHATRRSMARWPTVAGLLLLAVTGCVLLEKWFSAPVAFSHRLHGDVGVSCADCHAPGPEGEPLAADSALCLFCHEDLDADKPAALQATTVLAQLEGLGEHLSDEVIFSHQGHETYGQGCAECHAGIEVAEVVDGSWGRLSMDDCTSCHAAAGIDDGCATCHRELDVELAPPSHAHNWKQRHGQVVRSMSGRTADDCTLCHSEQTCVACHRDETPASHTNAFRLRTHGVMAGMDRESCNSCHKVDSCNQCHSEVLPSSHRGSFGGTRSTHCLTCHFPVGGESCVVCHKGTPSHLLAAPKPDDHSPGMNCRQCHGVDQPLPHVDNGNDCNFCHK